MPIPQTGLNISHPDIRTARIRNHGSHHARRTILELQSVNGTQSRSLLSRGSMLQAQGGESGLPYLWSLIVHFSPLVHATLALQRYLSCGSVLRVLIMVVSCISHLRVVWKPNWKWRHYVKRTHLFFIVKLGCTTSLLSRCADILRLSPKLSAKFLVKYRSSLNRSQFHRCIFEKQRPISAWSDLALSIVVAYLEQYDVRVGKPQSKGLVISFHCSDHQYMWVDLSSERT